MKYQVQVDGQQVEVEVLQQGSQFQVIIDGRAYQADLYEVSNTSFLSLIIDHRSLEFLVEKDRKRRGHYRVLRDTELYSVAVRPRTPTNSLLPSQATVFAEVENTVRAPMPGVIVELHVAPGDSIEKGQRLLIIEAMKMQNALRSPRAGTVKGVLVSKGERVAHDQVLVVLG